MSSCCRSPDTASGPGLPTFRSDDRHTVTPDDRNELDAVGHQVIVRHTAMAQGITRAMHDAAYVATMRQAGCGRLTTMCGLIARALADHVET